MIIDISWPIFPGMTEYKNRSSMKVTPIKTVQADGVCEALLTMHTHTGTHIDAPAHFIAGGKTIEQLSLNTFVGPCKVFDLSHLEEKITEQDVQGLGIAVGDRVLFKTRNSNRAINDLFDTTFVYLDFSAAQFLAAKSIQLIGIDYLGIERDQSNHDTHIVLLSNEIPILEGIRLGEIYAGKYRLICLPLAIQGSDAVPVRAVLQVI